MTVWRWALPLAAGSLCGWLAARARVEEGKPASSRPAVVKAGSGFAVSAAGAGQSREPAATASSNLAERRADEEFAKAEGLVARIAAGSVAELPGLLEEVKKLPAHHIANMLAMSALWQRWVELDAAGGLASLEKDGPSRDSLLATWVRRDPAAAVAWFRLHPDANPRIELQFGSSAAERAAYLAAMLEEPSFYTENRCGRLLSTLAEENAAVALALLEKLPPGDPSRAEVIRGIAYGTAKADPAAALAWLRGTGLTEGFAAAMEGLMNGCVHQHPEFVRDALADSGLPEDAQRQLSARVAMGLGKKDAVALREFLKAQPDGGLNVNTGYGVLHGISAGAMSIEEMASLTAEMQRTGIDISMSGLWDWTGRDPGQELLRAASLPEGGARELLLHSLSQAALLGGTQVTPAEVSGVPEAVRGEFTKHLMGAALAAGNEALASEWAALIPIPDVEKMLTSDKGHLFTAGSDLPFMLLERLPQEKRGPAITAVAREMAGADPQGAMAWAEALGAAEQPQAWAGVATGLARVDEAAAAEWVQGLPDDASGDPAVRSLVIELTVSDPDSALRWALAIHDEETRSGALSGVVQRWPEDELAGAMEAFENASLSEAERAAVDAAMAARKEGR